MRNHCPKRLNAKRLNAILDRAWIRIWDSDEIDHRHVTLGFEGQSEPRRPLICKLPAEKRRAIMSRAVQLLPNIVSELQWETIEEYERIVFDIVFFAACLVQTDRQSQTREAVSHVREKFNTALEAVTQFEKALAKFGKKSRYLWHGVAEQIADRDETFDPEALYGSIRCLNTHKRLLRICIAYLGPPSAADRRPHSRCKRELAVDCAWLCIQCCNEIPTTSSSSYFPLMCSLVYEIATGKAHEPFGGAVRAALRQVKAEIKDVEVSQPEQSSFRSGYKSNVLRHWQNVLADKSIDRQDIAIVEQIIDQILQDDEHAFDGPLVL